ncbi:hypothetical protein B0H14DRAFT_3512170 [Mycena olivaceomarginata]|nr:hypothetical protein B0H14DRAFT_3512170 [Mycena olivaceomarginata]
MNSDMEGAQVLGAARSFFKMRDTDHSKLSPGTLPEEVAPEIIKLCVTHAKRGILDFKSLVSDRDHQRLQDVVNIESAEDLDEFSQFTRPFTVRTAGPRETAARHTAVIRKSQEVRERPDEQATIEAEIAEMNETRKQAAERLKELMALMAAYGRDLSPQIGHGESAANTAAVPPAPPLCRPQVAALKCLTAAPAKAKCRPSAAPRGGTFVTLPPQGMEDLRTIFGNTSGSQANVAATVAFAPPTEHFPALPAAQMAASSDTSRSDSAPIDFNALGDLSDADFFAF